jgi:hypothetical protein
MVSVKLRKGQLPIGRYPPPRFFPIPRSHHHKRQRLARARRKQRCTARQRNHHRYLNLFHRTSYSVCPGRRLGPLHHSLQRRSSPPTGCASSHTAVQTRTCRHRTKKAVPQTCTLVQGGGETSAAQCSCARKTVAYHGGGLDLVQPSTQIYMTRSIGIETQRLESLPNRLFSQD